MRTVHILLQIAPLIVFVKGYVDDADNVRQEIHQYFDSDLVKDFGVRFNKFKDALQNALKTALTDSVGMPEMNIYVNRNDQEFKCGYIYFDLGKVQVILTDLYLEQLPRFETFNVFLALDNNVMTLKGTLGKIIIQGNYQALRNSSDVVYAVNNKYPPNSPLFLYQEVLPMGQLVITLDNCHIEHNVLAVLRGESVHFDYDTVPLRGCTYTVEIFQHDFGSPPIIFRGNPFVDVDKALDQYSIDWLVSKLLLEELETKTQAAGYSFINTTNILGGDLPQIRETLHKLVSKTNQFVATLVRNSKKGDDGSLALEDYTLSWDDSPEDKTGKIYEMTLSDMMLTGLNTIYSTNKGCPFKFGNTYVKIHLRFNSVQVRGKVIFQKADTSVTDPLKSNIDFVSSFEHFDLYVTLNLDPTGDPADFVFQLGTFQKKSFSVPDVVFDPMESVVNGYLQHRIFVEIKTKLKARLLAAFSPLYSDQSIDQSNSQPLDKGTIPANCKKYVEPYLNSHSQPPDTEPSDENRDEAHPETATESEPEDQTQADDSQEVHTQTPPKSKTKGKGSDEKTRLYLPNLQWQALPNLPMLDLHAPFNYYKSKGR